MSVGVFGNGQKVLCIINVVFRGGDGVGKGMGCPAHTTERWRGTSPASNVSLEPAHTGGRQGVACDPKGGGLCAVAPEGET